MVTKNPIERHTTLTFPAEFPQTAKTAIAEVLERIPQEEHRMGFVADVNGMTIALTNPSQLEAGKAIEHYRKGIVGELAQVNRVSDESVFDDPEATANEIAGYFRAMLRAQSRGGSAVGGAIPGY